MKKQPVQPQSLVLLFSLCLLLVLSVSAQNLTIPEIMAEPSLAGQRPSGARLSPDGTKLIFLWNAEGKPKRDLYMVSTGGGTPEVILRVSDLPARPRPPERENKLNYGVELRDEFARDREGPSLGGFAWSPDSQKLIFSHNGDIFVLTLADRSVKQVTFTDVVESGGRILDDGRIFYMQAGNSFVFDPKDSTLTQVNRQVSGPGQGGPRGAAGGGGFGAGGGFSSVNDQMTKGYVTVSDTSKHRELSVPNYLPELVTIQTIRRGWATQKVYAYEVNKTTPPVEIKLPAAEGVSSFRRSAWTADGNHLLVDRIDRDTKRRQLFFVADAGSAKQNIILVTEHTDDKWQAQLSVIYEPHPNDPNVLYFTSEEDGYNHLYLAKVDIGNGKAEIKQLTSGNWQVEWAKWTNDGKILYASTENTYKERELYLLDPATGGKTMLPSPIKGMKGSFALSEKGDRQIVTYELSTWNRPGDLYVQPVCSPCSPSDAPVKLTDTIPAKFNSLQFTTPNFVEIASRDGKRIPAKIYLPPGHNARSRTKYPMVIFVHGAGYLQNVINGWNNYYREFMFNDMLAKTGYVVLDIDYRGSAGYGRDWRTDVYDFLGGKDYEDHIDSIDHMVANYGVDQSRIGVYGGSYGGFMAGMLVMRAPERIAAAAALRPVFDWKNYYAANPGYTAQRLGHPDKNPEWYKRSSPITYADKLEKPLLILHGVIDDNVHVQDSMQLVEKLIRLRKTKYFDLMVYPAERHGFERPESWIDEYERIHSLFEKHLR